MFTFSHYNFNVTDLERSLEFYGKALGLKEFRRKTADDGRYVIAYLRDAAQSDFYLELTWLRDWDKPCYELGDNEMHLAFTSDDTAAAHELHKSMGCICFENPSMGVYFIEDPDGYWLEIIPKKK